MHKKALSSDEAFRLVEGRGFRHSEVAEIYRVTVSAVRKMLAREYARRGIVRPDVARGRRHVRQISETTEQVWL